MKVPPRKARTLQRGVHIVAFDVLFAYLYTPLDTNSAFDVIVRAIVIPTLIVTGWVPLSFPF
jgi:hypothetical protein